jgi:CBS domain-containing protein
MITVENVMTTELTAIQRETTLKHVARILVQRGISGLPVDDAEGHVVGVVSEADLLIKEQGQEALTHRRGARIRGESKRTRTGLAKVHATTAGEAMTSPAITIGPEASLPAAAAIMVDRAINRLPVVKDGALVGIVSRADLVRAYVRSDDQIAEYIRYDLLLRHLLVNPLLFDLTVKDGVVTIKGQADTRSIAEMIERLVATVPGVIAVDANVTWAYDDGRVAAPERDLVYPSTR